MGALGATGAAGCDVVRRLATAARSADGDEYAGNAKSKRLSLSSDVNEIFAVNFAGSASGSMRASKNAPLRASTSGADASSRVVPVFGSNTSFVTTRPRTLRACREAERLREIVVDVHAEAAGSRIGAFEVMPVVGRHEEDAAVLRVVIAVRARRVARHHRRSIGAFAGSICDTSRLPAHVNVSAAVFCTRSREQIRHLPGFGCSMTAWTGQVYRRTSRTGSRSMPQMLHAPFFASSTSGCIGQVHEMAGSWAAGAVARTIAATDDRENPRVHRIIASVAKGTGATHLRVGARGRRRDERRRHQGARDRTDRCAPERPARGSRRPARARSCRARSMARIGPEIPSSPIPRAESTGADPVASATARRDRATPRSSRSKRMIVRPA